MLRQPLVFEHVHESRLAGVVQPQEQDFGVLVVQPQRVEHAVEPCSQEGRRSAGRGAAGSLASGRVRSQLRRNILARPVEQRKGWGARRRVRKGAGPVSSGIPPPRDPSRPPLPASMDCVNTFKCGGQSVQGTGVAGGAGGAGPPWPAASQPAASRRPCGAGECAGCTGGLAWPAAAGCQGLQLLARKKDTVWATTQKHTVGAPKQPQLLDAGCASLNRAIEYM